MPTLTDQADRRVIIDRRPGQYIAFPDVCLTGEGKLLAVYRESNKHAADRSMLLTRESADLGHTWSPIRILDARLGHCPRIKRLSDNALAIIEDSNNALFWSYDHGRTFASRPSGANLDIPDRLLELDANTFLTACHCPRGTHPQPKMGQPRTEQMVYVTTTRGASFPALSVLAADPVLTLCEASMTRLPDGRILALMRENGMVYEPMYACLSADGGKTWTTPAPTPLLGHRPCLDVTSQGELLVTYRNVGPDGGTAAWIGTMDELFTEYAVHGRTPSPDNPRLTREGLHIENKAGRGACARYCLRPITDPEYATAELTAEVRVDRADTDGCAIHFGIWWRLFPDRIEPDGDHKPIAVEKGRFHTLRFTYKPGKVALSVDGKRRARIDADPMGAETRAFVFGTRSPFEDNGGKHVWKSVSHRVREPRYGRDYRYSWDFTQGLPDAWARKRVLELANDRFAAPMDYGYSGWVELPDGRFFCAYHHGGGDEEGYKAGFSSHVQGTWFERGDFDQLEPRSLSA